MIKQILLLVAVLSMSTVIMQQESVYGQQATVSNSLFIDPDCGLNMASTTMNFGNADPDGSAGEQTLSIENTGSVVADIDIHATDWTNDEDGTTIILNGEQTFFATSDLGASTLISAKTATNNTNTYVTMGTVAATTTNSTYWDVDTSLVSGQEAFTGSISQTLTIVMSC